MNFGYLHPALQSIIDQNISQQGEASVGQDLDLFQAISQYIAKLEAENIALESKLNSSKAELNRLTLQLKNGNDGQLRKQKERFISIINSMRDGLCVIDEAGLITFANPMAERLFGKNNILGESFFSHIEFSNSLPKNLGSNTSRPPTQSQLLTLANSQGKKIPLKASISDLRDESNRFVGQVIVFSDYSLELETHRRLEQARDQAVEMTKLKSEFLATMSHEIRTPLNGIVSLVSLLEMSELDQEQTEDVSDIRASANQLQSIISNVLDLSKIESGKMYLDYQKFSITHLINDVTRIFHGQFEEKGIFLITETIGDLPTYVSADYTRLKQVLVNLVGNAIKFTGVDGCIILLLKGKKQEHNFYSIEFSIIDTGVGIPQNRIGALFNPFVQADGSITRNFGGTGLGLSICKNLVDLMGGNIEVRSKEGIGSVFTFSLILEEPIFSEESLGRLRTIKQSNSHINSKSNSAKILVVDDNQINLSTISRYLKKSGLETFQASSGDEALKIAGNNEIDLILLDLHLPIMSGYEVTRCIRSSKSEISNIPIIAITADVLQGTEQACLEAGFDLFLSKPLNLLDLVKSIDSFIEKDARIS